MTQITKGGSLVSHELIPFNLITVYSATGIKEADNSWNNELWNELERIIELLQQSCNAFLIIGNFDAHIAGMFPPSCLL